MTMQQIYLAIPLLPLLAAVIVGLFGKQLPRAAAHVITIVGVGASFGLSAYVLKDALLGHVYNDTVYTWLKSGNVSFEVGFLIDRLSAMMMVAMVFIFIFTMLMGASTTMITFVFVVLFFTKLICFVPGRFYKYLKRRIKMDDKYEEYQAHYPK